MKMGSATGMAMPPAGAQIPSTPHSRRTLDASKLASFVDPLPLPVQLQPQGRRSSAEHNAVDAPYYRIDVKQIFCRLHRDLPPARMWSYGETSAPVLIEAHSNQGVLIDWVNNLPAKHFLPLDAPMKGMEDAPETRMVTHVHGARVPSLSDGYPEDWFAPGQSKLCFYPNGQDATALWFHDHAMGNSRFNVFAGLMGWYLIRDAHEQSLGLPSGRYELPLQIYDRSFDPAGQLYYPNPPDEGVWAQEFLGDAMVVNGKVKPFLDVEPRPYRLRIVNTANSRFFSLALSNGRSFQVIGSDQGLLPAPVEMHRFVLAPAERTDLIVDFSTMAGEHVVLHSDTLDLMQFRVAASSTTSVSPPASASAIPRRTSAALALPNPSPIPALLRPVPRIPESQAERTRLMTLNQFDGDSGDPMVMLLNRKHWVDPVTEIVKLDSTEIWSIVNLTDETHPIHLHLVRFQILDRQPIAIEDYITDDQLHPIGPVIPPEAQELGWKDVVQCPSGTVTRIIIPFHGFIGRYLWHCHILEHEANDMMRPYDIVS
jgi:spore coat protein A